MRALSPACFLVVTVALTMLDEMWVVAGSPRKDAMLPATPTMTPDEGLAPITGAMATMRFV